MDAVQDTMRANAVHAAVDLLNKVAGEANRAGLAVHIDVQRRRGVGCRDLDIVDAKVMRVLD